MLGMRKGAAVGMEGGHRSHKNGLVPDWQGLNCSGTGVVQLGMKDTDGWEGGWPVVTCKHGDASFVEELDPFCRAKNSVADGDDKVRIVLVFDVPLRGHIEVFFIVEDVILQSPNVILEMQLFFLICIIPPFDSFGKSPSNVCCKSEARYALVVEFKGYKGSVG